MKTLKELQVIEELKNLKPGSFQHITYISDAKVLKRCELENVKIEKITDTTARFGIEFANMKINDGKKVGSMLYGKYMKDLEKYILKYEKDGDVRYYLRGYIVNDKNTIVKYLMNGVETSVEWLVENNYLSKSALKIEHNESGLIQPKLNNIISIGKLSVL